MLSKTVFVLEQMNNAIIYSKFFSKSELHMVVRMDRQKIKILIKIKSNKYKFFIHKMNKMIILLKTG